MVLSLSPTPVSLRTFLSISPAPLSFTLPSLSLSLSLSFSRIPPRFIDLSLCDFLCFFLPHLCLTLLSLSLSVSRPYLSFYLSRTPISPPTFLSPSPSPIPVSLSHPVFLSIFFSRSFSPTLVPLVSLSLSYPCLSFSFSVSAVFSLRGSLSLSLLHYWFSR